jgi:hypothetical protein
LSWVFLLGFFFKNPLFVLGVFARFVCSIICRRKYGILRVGWMSGLGGFLER